MKKSILTSLLTIFTFSGCWVNDGISFNDSSSKLSCTVTYEGNGNTSGSVPVDNGSYRSSDSVTVLNNTGTLVKTNHTFSGWNTAADGSGTTYAPNTTFTISQNTTLYAKWNVDTYTVTYNGNGADSGTAPTDANSPYGVGSLVTVLSNLGNLVKTGLVFIGWNTAANGSSTDYAAAATFTMPAANTTLYARWVTGYAVTYNSNGASSGSAPTDSSSPYAAGAVVTILGKGTLARGGYAFAGWNTAADGSGTDYTAAATFTMPASARNFYAKWTVLTPHTVTYDGNGASSGSVPVDGNTYWLGAVVPVAGNSGSLTKVGNTFAGWELIEDSSVNSVGETFYMPDNNVTLRARWVANGSYSISYNGNGHTGGTVPSSGVFISGNTVTVLGNTGSLVRGNDTFLGWNTTANGTGTNYAAGATFTASAHTVLYARWTPIYTLTFDGNGADGGSMSPIGIAGKTSTKLPANSFTQTLKVFVGWAITPTGAITYNDQQSFPMENANTTLYAVWADANTLLVNYNFNGQNTNDGSGQGNGGTANNVSYVPEGSGYAIQLNGTNSYVSLPSGMVYNNELSFTIMMRFKATPSQQGGLFGYQNTVVGGASTKFTPVLAVRSDGRLRGEIYTTGGQLQVISDKSVNDGEWHTVYFSNNNSTSTIKLFLDGVLLQQNTGTLSRYNDMTVNQIGTNRSYGRVLMPNANSSSNDWYYFNGLIDDFFFYNTAL